MKTRFSSSLFVGSATLLTLAGSAFAQDAIAPLPPEPTPAPAAAAPTAATAAPAAPAAGAAAAPSDAEAEALAAALSSGSDSTAAAVADAQEFKLNIYGFADFLYQTRLNDFQLATPYPTFMVGNLNLYVGAELGSGWRTLTERLGGHAEYADRVLIGPIELIVRDVDDKGRITGVGLSFEPTAPVARVPVFLSAGEMGDRLSAFIRNWRKPTETQLAEARADEKPAPEPAAEKAATES